MPRLLLGLNIGNGFTRSSRGLPCISIQISIKVEGVIMWSVSVSAVDIIDVTQLFEGFTTAISSYRSSIRGCFLSMRQFDMRVYSC